MRLAARVRNRGMRVPDDDIVSTDIVLPSDDGDVTFDRGTARGADDVDCHPTARSRPFRNCPGRCIVPAHAMAERYTMPELISTHGLILLCIAATEEQTVARLAAVAGVSERTVTRVVTDLVEAGYVTRRRQGTRNAYVVCREAEVSDPVGHGWRLERLLERTPRTLEAAGSQPV